VTYVRRISLKEIVDGVVRGGDIVIGLTITSASAVIVGVSGSTVLVLGVTTCTAREAKRIKSECVCSALEWSRFEPDEQMTTGLAPAAFATISFVVKQTEHLGLPLSQVLCGPQQLNHVEVSACFILTSSKAKDVLWMCLKWRTIRVTCKDSEP
jgi:hypothetical protein